MSKPDEAKFLELVHQRIAAIAQVAEFGEITEDDPKGMIGIIAVLAMAGFGEYLIGAAPVPKKEIDQTLEGVREMAGIVLHEMKALDAKFERLRELN